MTLIIIWRIHNSTKVLVTTTKVLVTYYVNYVFQKVILPFITLAVLITSGFTMHNLSPINTLNSFRTIKKMTFWAFSITTRMHSSHCAKLDVCQTRCWPLWDLIKLLACGEVGAALLMMSLAVLRQSLMESWSDDSWNCCHNRRNTGHRDTPLYHSCALLL